MNLKLLFFSYPIMERKMKTQIFSSFESFQNRKDKKIGTGDVGSLKHA